MLGFIACDDKSDLGVMQTNPQETVMSAEGVTVTFGEALEGNTLNLSDYEEAMIPVVKLVEAVDLSENANVEFKMDLASKEDFSNAITLDVVDGAVSCTDWDAYFRSALGKSPKEKPNYVRFAAYISQEVGGAKQLLRVGGSDTWFAQKTLNVTPIPMDFTIYPNYYLIGTINGWGMNSDYPFSHSAADVYDDPVFSIVVTISEEDAANGWWWKIASSYAVENNSWSVGVAGTVTNGDEALSGNLKEGADGDEAQAGCVKEAGTYMFTINMLDLTYEFKPLSYLYTPGNANGWNPAESNRLQFNADMNAYFGYVYLDGEFKFTSVPGWDGTNYGNSGTEGQLSTDGGAGNLSAPAGLYYAVVDTAALTYSLSKVDSFDIMGGFNGWSDPVVMTPTLNPLVWTANINIAPGDEFKFRANGSWDINLGGSMLNLIPGAANLVAPVAATSVTLDLSVLPYACILN